MSTFKAATILLITIATTKAISQKYEGFIGFVTAHQVKIDVNKWTRKFTGTFEFVPGLPLPFYGTVRDGWFKSNQWEPTRVQISNNSILGEGVWLWRKK